MSLPHVFDNGVEVDDARLQHLLAAEGEKLARERGGAIGSAMMTSLCAAGVALREHVEQKLGVALDDHQEIVEVVSDATGEAADGFHFLRLAELIFSGAGARRRLARRRGKRGGRRIRGDAR